MKNLFQILICACALIPFTACERKTVEISVAFQQDTVINGVKTKTTTKERRLRQLTWTEQDSIDEMIGTSENLISPYLARTTHEDTVVYLDRLIAYWHQDSLVGRRQFRACNLFYFTRNRRSTSY